MTELVTIRTLHTYAGDIAALRRARRWLADRSILSKVDTIKRGHHCFTLHVPTGRDEAWARHQLSVVMEEVAHIAHYEPFVWKETQVEAVGSIRRPEPKPVDMRDHVREQSGLIATYADDGAYRSAARVAHDLASVLARHVAYLESEGL